MSIGTVGKLQWNVGFDQPALEFRYCLADGWTVVLVQARIDMRGAGDDFDAIGNGDAGHGQRGFQIRRPIVDARKQMAVQVNHGGVG